jgi:hypothetical protein
MNTASRKIVRLLFCLILILSWITMPRVSLSADPQNAPKQKITALYLYNFLLFVDWPENAASDTIKLATYGAPQVYEALKLMAGKTIKGKKLVVFSLARPEGLNDCCQVLFVGDKEPQVLREFLKEVNGKPILTVSDKAGFVRLGGMVFFKDPGALRKDGKKQKRFIINLSAVRKSRLKIRSRLLRMSDIVYDTEPENLEMP